MANRPTFKHQHSFGGADEGPSYEMKPIGTTVVEEVSEADGNDAGESREEAEKRGTQEDQHDMHRMNKVCLSNILGVIVVDTNQRSKNCAATSASCPSSATVSYLVTHGCCP